MAMILLLVAAFLTLQQPAPAAQTPQGAASSAAPLDYEFFKTRVQPIFLNKRPGHARCLVCHETGTPRLQPLPPGQPMWDEDASRKNFEAWQRVVVPGKPLASRLLLHPLAAEAGGDPFHAGGKHWTSQGDAEWQTLAAWVAGATTAPTAPTQSATMKARVVQTDSAGDNVHVIDVATNKVVGVIEGIEVPHGAAIAPDGTRIYITNESLSTVDVVDAKTLKVTGRVKLSGHPNNLSVTPDGRRVYVGIAQAPGAVDVIDTRSLTNVKSVPVQGAVHNVYVTPDGKYAVSGSVASSVISVIDTATDSVAWTLKESSGIRPMVFTTNPDGSTRQIVVQLSNYHGIVVVDFATRKEVNRVALPDVPGRPRETDGIQGLPAHGLAISGDGKTLWSTSKFYDYVAAYSLPDFTLVKTVDVGLHPEWLTMAPASNSLYVAVAGQNATVVVDTREMRVVATIPVGQVPKRNASGMLASQ